MIRVQLLTHEILKVDVYVVPTQQKLHVNIYVIHLSTWDYIHGRDKNFNKVRTLHQVFIAKLYTISLY